jgi:hypothetical protein
MAEDDFGVDPYDLLDYSPRESFFSFVNEQQSAPQRRYFQNQFQDIQNQYLGQLGQSLRRGEVADQSFTDFLGGFNFGDRYRGLPPSMRGALASRFAPSVQTFF